MSVAETEDRPIWGDPLRDALSDIEHEIGQVRGYARLLFILLNEYSDDTPLGNGVGCLAEAIERSVKILDDAHAVAWRHATPLVEAA